MYGVICFPDWKEDKLNLYLFDDLGLANLLFIEFHNIRFIPVECWPFNTKSKKRYDYGYRMCANINNSSQRGTLSINPDKYYFPKSAIINDGVDDSGLSCILLLISDELLTTLTPHYNLVYPKLEKMICNNTKEPWDLLDSLDRPHNYEIISIENIKRRKLIPLEILAKHISHLKDNLQILILWSEEFKTLYLRNHIILV